MEKIAIISDIHGNLEALKSVLIDIKKENINNIYCLGDIIGKGMHPNECFGMISDNTKVIVRGNFEKWIGLESDYASKVWCFNRTLLNNDTYRGIRSLPFSYEFYLSGRLVRLFHATPYDINKKIFAFSNNEALKSMFYKPLDTVIDGYSDVAIYGHTHNAFVSSLYNRTLINAGSVGIPLDLIHDDMFDGCPGFTTMAHYLILEGELNSLEKGYMGIMIKEVPYDIESELKDSKNNMDKIGYEMELRLGKYRDQNRLNRIINENK